MSKIPTNIHLTDKNNLINKFFADYADYTAPQRQEILGAWNFLCDLSADTMRPWGEPFFVHSLRVAGILADNRFDAETIIAGILHNILLLDNTKSDEIKTIFGTRVADLVVSTTRITGLNLHNKNRHEAEAARKMIFTLVDDIRVIFIKLADRLDYIRNAVHFTGTEQKELAQEVIDIWAPLANRLGMANLKTEMEDLSLKISNPDVFAQLKQLVALKKQEREKYLEKAQKEIYKAASRAGIDIIVHTRAKHFYSIYQKIRKKNRSAEELSDLQAVRILCNTANDCYTMVGLMHGMWKPMDGRFKDFIAVPKSNGYQSIHTTVMNGATPLEIQIRTHAMHEIAEHGVASHWLYKKGFNKDSVNTHNADLVHDLRELRKEYSQDNDLFSQIKKELLRDCVLVFTPQGDIREFPQGANAIDFAYAIHSGIGETIVGAKADGKIIPLSRPMENTQVIEILTNPQAHPTVNQVNTVKTSRARSKIRSWLSANIPDFEFDKPTQTGISSKKAGSQKNSKKSDAVENPDTKTVRTHNNTHAGNEVGICIDGTANIMIKTALCCNPQYKDDIVGYVSRGRGIIVHKKNCSDFANIPNVAERTV
ncbi:MAG: HD domain-containing protein, partial [Spirochaetales bacterium]